jgi:23S rRNA (uracil1939-C5)-methyltransferase
MIVDDIMKYPKSTIVTLDRIIGGGQAIGTLASGKKAILWGGLPGEKVEFMTTKSKKNFVEGIVTNVLEPSSERVDPADPESYLSTSPWQIMTFEAEQHYKAALIEEAFELHDIVLPAPITVYSNNVTSHYRNKVEFSWFGDVDDNGDETLDLAFFRRGSKGKVIVDRCELLPDEMMKLGYELRTLLISKGVTAKLLKTLLIRCNQQRECVWQLYVKDEAANVISPAEAQKLSALGGEIIYSNPKSPASVITKRLATFGTTTLTDTVHGEEFRYATEGFFQVNIPVYEQALTDMQHYVEDKPVVDLYSGVGTIGLIIGGSNVALVEVNEHAVREMRANIKRMQREGAQAILTASEHALEYISSESCIIVDPPRAGLHADVVKRLLEEKPHRIIYLSCNPVTQARDTALLSEAYGIRHHQGYNFFPRTPHIEHLVVLDLVESKA